MTNNLLNRAGATEIETSKRSAQKEAMQYEASVTKYIFDEQQAEKDGKISGSQLFSLFTADIITQDVLFTR